MLTDLRYAFRQLAKSPGFTTVAVITLALGIGANSSVFQLINAVRLRSLPVQAPQELAEIRIADTTGIRGHHGAPGNFTYPLWTKLREEQQVFSGICAWGRETFELAPAGESHPVRGLRVSGDFFHVLGIRPDRGRLFSTTDDRRDHNTEGVVISHAFWQREFGGDPDIIGRKLPLNGRMLEIIGVTPAGFFGIEIGASFDVAVPLTLGRDHLDDGLDWWLGVIGRLSPGVTFEHANAQLRARSGSVFAATLPANYPAENVKDYHAFKLAASPLAQSPSHVRRDYSNSLLLLLGLTGFVLLIACANLANLMLARALGREREIALRLVLGASRFAIVRQLMTESLLLAVSGAVLAALVSAWFTDALISYFGRDHNVVLQLAIDGRVFGFHAAIAMLACLLFGLAPAWRAMRVDANEVLKHGARGLTTSRDRLSLRSALVVGQVAISLVLVVGALLLARSFRQLIRVELGFEPARLLVVEMERYPNLTREQVPEFKRQLFDAVRSTPGVESVADSLLVPLTGGSWDNRVWMDGTQPVTAKAVNFNAVSEAYFATVGTPLLAGRDFDEHDTANAPPVAIVTETFARQFGGAASPVGKRFWIEATSWRPVKRVEIVGVVKDAKYFSLREGPRAVVYLPELQETHFGGLGRILVRSRLPWNTLAPALKAKLAAVRPSFTFNLQSLRAEIDDSLLREQLMTTLSGFFGGLALLLSLLGFYGVMSFSIAQRTSEIGVRMALGAQRKDILRLIVGQGGRLAALGILLGVGGALALTRLLQGELYAIAANDAASYIVAITLLLSVALLACWLPARRATKVDPMIALRAE
jgi:predicted permease